MACHVYLHTNIRRPQREQGERVKKKVSFRHCRLAPADAPAAGKVFGKAVQQQRRRSPLNEGENRLYSLIPNFCD